MGNSLLGQVLLKMDYVETKFPSIHEIDMITLDRETIQIPKDKVSLVVNITDKHPQSKEYLASLVEFKNKYPNLEIFAFPCH